MTDRLTEIRSDKEVIYPLKISVRPIAIVFVNTGAHCITSDGNLCSQIFTAASHITDITPFHGPSTN